MTLTKQQVLERLCQLCTKVNDKKFGHKIPTDCFCEQSFSNPALESLKTAIHDLGKALNDPRLSMDYKFDSEVLEFIEAAVEEKL